MGVSAALALPSILWVNSCAHQTKNSATTLPNSAQGEPYKHFELSASGFELDCNPKVDLYDY